MGVEGIDELAGGNGEQPQNDAQGSDADEQSQQSEQGSDVAEKNTEPSAPVDGTPPADAHEQTQQPQQDEAQETDGPSDPNHGDRQSASDDDGA